MICRRCNSKLDARSCCPNCGFDESLAFAYYPTLEYVDANEEGGTDTVGEKSKPPKTAIWIAVAAVALLLVLIIFVVNSCGTEKPPVTPTPMAAVTPASNILASGTCGEKCTWTLDANGVLTVSGTGAMYDYDLDQNKTPWFEQRGDVTQIVVQNGVTRIGKCAFLSCISAKKIIIPQSVIEIGEAALYGCYLETIEVNSENKAYCTSDDVLFSRDQTRLIRYPIGKNSFRYELPTSVTDIEADAFQGAKLSEITLTEALRTIGEGAFSECINLSTIVIPPGVEELPSFVFSSCTNLKTVYLPSSIKSFSELVFIESGLTDINYAGTRQQWEDVLHNVWKYTSSIWDTWNNHFPGVTVHYNAWSK